MSGSNRRRWERRDLKIGAVPTPDQAKALDLLRDREVAESKLSKASKEIERLERERDEAIERQRERSLACSATCERVATELRAARVETETVRDDLGVANVARHAMAAEIERMGRRIAALESRLERVVSPLAELREPEEDLGTLPEAEREALLREAFPEFVVEPPREADWVRGQSGR